MRGNEKVIAELNAALRAELTAILQYMVHAEMRHNWGFGKLGDEIRKQAIEEMRHAERLIERILYLDGTPKVDIGLQPKIGATVREQIANDLAAELDAVRQYNAAAELCRESSDNGSRELFVSLLQDEEMHVDHHEALQTIIEQAGYENFLAQQLDSGSEGH
jgi:bacterioferritin